MKITMDLTNEEIKELLEAMIEVERRKNPSTRSSRKLRIYIPNHDKLVTMTHAEFADTCKHFKQMAVRSKSRVWYADLLGMLGFKNVGRWITEYGWEKGNLVDIYLKQTPGSVEDCYELVTNAKLLK